MSLWRCSGTLCLDNQGQPAPGAQANFYVAGTSQPLQVYQDAALSIGARTPIVADGAGRWPLIFLPYQSYREQIVLPGGQSISDLDGIDNPAPPSANAAIDPTTLYQTGDVVSRLEKGPRAGFIRWNGGTIGNQSSGATERANNDCLPLYTHLWNNVPDSICTVTGGRGLTPSADFNAGKTMKLPDARGCSLVGLDDMGALAAGLLSGVPVVTGSVTTPGSTVGENAHALTVAELAQHTHTNTATSTNTVTASATAASTFSGSASSSASSSTSNSASASASSTTTTTSGLTASTSIDFNGSHNHGVTVNVPGSFSGVQSGTSLQVPTQSPTATYATTTDGYHNHGATTSISGSLTSTTTTTVTPSVSSTTTTSVTTTVSGTVTTTVTPSVTVGTTTTVTINNTGSGTAHNTVQRSILVTYYQKL